jgi:hypothetical protein
LSNKLGHQQPREPAIQDERNNNRYQANGNRHDFTSDFDFSNLVLNKLKELRSKHRRPVTLNSLAGEFGQRFARAELIEILRSLQEAGEIRNIPGQELSYDVI